MNQREIDPIIAARDRLTDRRDEQVDWEAVAAFDAALADVPPGQDNRVDSYLGRDCAVMPKRPDYGLTSDDMTRIVQDAMNQPPIEY